MVDPTDPQYDPELDAMAEASFQRDGGEAAWDGRPSPENWAEFIAEARVMRAALDRYRDEQPLPEPYGPWREYGSAAVAVDPQPEPECTCIAHRPESWLEPADVEPNPYCPVHGEAAAVDPSPPEPDHTDHFGWTGKRDDATYRSAAVGQPVEPDPQTYDDGEGTHPTDTAAAYNDGWDQCERVTLAARTQVGWWDGTDFWYWSFGQQNPIPEGWLPVWVEGEQP